MTYLDTLGRLRGNKEKSDLNIGKKRSFMRKCLNCHFQHVSGKIQTYLVKEGIGEIDMTRSKGNLMVR